MGVVGGGGVVPLVVSGRGVAALCGQAGRLGEWLAGEGSCSVVDVGFSLAVGRSAFEDRAVVLAGAGGREGVVSGLVGWLRGSLLGGVVRGVAGVGGGGRGVCVSGAGFAVGGDGG